VTARGCRRAVGAARRLRRWEWLCKAASVRDARLHDARHTAATLLLEQGVDISVVQEILGHSTLAVTKGYAHVTSRLAREAAERMSRALWDTPDDDGPTVAEK
jgi:site-specific recombinase XerD